MEQLSQHCKCIGIKTWQTSTLKVEKIHPSLTSKEIRFSTYNSQPQTIDPTRVTNLSWNPRAFLYKGFLSSKECDHLINLAKDHLEKSTVAYGPGNFTFSTTRTSSGMSISIAQDDIVANIEDRIAAWTFLPLENGEGIQILRYKKGEKYEAHMDGPRIATVLMYLSDVQKGGETVFPLSKPHTSKLKGEEWSDCAKQGFAVKPKKGDALLFFSVHPNGSRDQTSRHASCPVIAGEKWSATKWIHAENSYS